MCELTDSPTVMAMQTFRIFCNGQAGPPGGQINDASEIPTARIRGKASENAENRPDLSDSSSSIPTE